MRRLKLPIPTIPIFVGFLIVAALTFFVIAPTGTTQSNDQVITTASQERGTPMVQTADMTNLWLCGTCHCAERPPGPGRYTFEVNRF